jgi:serine/threonine-protein kinase
MDLNQRIGDYEILDELGSGGMGRVFRVRNLISDRVEAMKILLPDLAGRQDLAARFLREIKLLATLNHPNIAALRTALTADNQLVMIMEYVEGQSLAARLVHGPIATGDALSYIDQVLDALGYAHAQQIIHRDVKPANMMLTPQGIVKLTDFGIARSRNDQSLTMTGTTTGSLAYMPPEQVRGEATDARSDLYSVGISLYEMVTGRRPFEVGGDFAVMAAHVNAQPTPPIALQPGLPAALNELILKAMAKEPTARFQTAGELRSAIAALSGSGSRTAARNATVLVSAATSTAEPIAMPDELRRAAAQGMAERAGTMLDTKTPVGQAIAAAGGQVSASVPTARIRSGHPFMFVALGACLVVVALVGTGLYLGRAEAGPGSSRAGQDHAAPAASVQAPAEAAPGGGQSTAEPAGTVAPSAPATPPPDASGPIPPPAAVTPVTPASSEVPAGPVSAHSLSPPAPATSDARTLRAPDRSHSDVRQPAARAESSSSDIRAEEPRGEGTAGAKDAAREAGTSATTAKAQDSAQEAVRLDQLEEEIDQLGARAVVVNTSLDRLQQQQARQGLGLRGDIAARQETMNGNLAKAREAIVKKDAGRALKYRIAAETDVEALERFLGR